MKVFRLALGVILLLSANALGREPRIGDSVIVVAAKAEVKSKEGTLGTIPQGTQFSVKQKSGQWLLGLFQFDGGSVFGWVQPSSVRVMEPDTRLRPTHKFTWLNLLMARDKLDGTFSLEDHVDYYMRLTRSQVWNTYHDNEFQLSKRRAETLVILRKHLADFDVQQDFMLKTELTFGKYDFERGMFPIKEATKENYWYKSRRKYSDKLPSSLEVYLQDPELISGIPMAADKAERFLASLHNRYDDISREVYANIRLRIVRVRASDELEAEVQWAQFFRDEGRTRLIYETPRTPTQAKFPEVGFKPTKPKKAPQPARMIPTALARQGSVPRIQTTNFTAAQTRVQPTAYPTSQTTYVPTGQFYPRAAVQQPFPQGQS